MAAIVIAQPPTKADHEGRADIYTDDYPSTASARGSAVARRRFAPTPSMQRDRRQSEEIVRDDQVSSMQTEALRDGDVYGYNTGVYVMDDAYEYDVSDWNDAWGQPVGVYRRSYDSNGQLIGLDRFRRGMDSPDLSYRYRYPSTGTIVEEQIMVDGSRRILREVTIDEFEANQGPGNQPYLDNREINEHYQNQNSVPDRPSSPGPASKTPSSPY